MESKPFMSAAALLVGLVLTGHGVQAETSNPSGPPEVEGDRAKQRTEGPPPVIQREDQGETTWKHIRGEVERVKRVNVRGGQGDHLVALVSGERGRYIFVDLGPAQQYREVPVMSGDSVSVRGPLAWISDRKVLMAKRVRVNGESVTVKRPSALEGRQLDRRSLKDDEGPVTGQIEQAKELRLHGIDKRHVVVRMKAQDGRQLLADLGSPKELKGVSLEQGRSITVQGPTIHVSGKPLILARQVSAEGKQVEIDRDIGSVMPASSPAHRMPATGDQQQASDQQAITGEIVVRGQVPGADTNGFYVLQDQSGLEQYLIVTPEIKNRGFRLGDHITAQVNSDGTVVSMNKTEEDMSSRHEADVSPVP
jgi:hypothetical protein